MPRGKFHKDTQKSRAGISAFEPLTPKDLKREIDIMVIDEVPAPKIAKAIQERYRAGEWPDAGAHLDDWTLDDWTIEVARGVRRIHPRRPPGLPPISRGRPSKSADDPTHRELLLASARAKRVKLEAEAKAAISEGEIEDLDMDAKANLLLLRREILSRMPVSEQAGLLVDLAREAKSATARQAIIQILNITGQLGANTPESPGSGPIFALPEGAGPGIR